ncbi:Sporulation protein YlmC, PRC-barrel domain family [Haladaptatus litoreus]|uniref:Sporulation protein YlmC, PRC-barrel domain family n=1 Tax=Haladaptatus litoreus TaxID=553468 RepID=A0A1N7DLZ3_9EURY|nr:PRC-barrel domain-containing protein [Haladaptatus litoreus]SIR76840.1 Sporulation protein YlmC, PRC-barrel domain family [Haladaptatus litoreus]
MSNIFIENIIGMDVSSTNGVAIGRLTNITMNFKTGQLSNLVINPNEGSDVYNQEWTNENGTIQIPITKVKAVNDHVLVEIDDLKQFKS